MANTGKNTLFIVLLLAVIVLLLFLNMVLGSVHIPMGSVWNILTGQGEEPGAWQNIIWKSRFPQALTALVAGAGLSISGLQMQTVFRNPLAGPSVLGIGSGAVWELHLSYYSPAASEGSPSVIWDSLEKWPFP